MNIYKKHANNRSVGWSCWHFEWCTKYRYKIFTFEKDKNLCSIFLREGAKRYSFEILDLEVDNNHVHVLASLPLRMNPIDVVGHLKGFTSTCLFIALPRLGKVYEKGHLWSPGKFVASVGHITLEKAKVYIEEHHAKILVIIIGIPSPNKVRSQPKAEPLGMGGCQIIC